MLLLRVNGKVCASLGLLRLLCLCSHLTKQRWVYRERRGTLPRIRSLALANFHHRAFLKIRWEQLASAVMLISCSHTSRNGDRATLGAAFSLRVFWPFGRSLYSNRAKHSFQPGPLLWRFSSPIMGNDSHFSTAASWFETDPLWLSHVRTGSKPIPIEVL